MLKKINANGVISDEGFSIQIKHVEQMEYKFKDKMVVLEIIYSPSTQKIKIHVTKASYWTTPHEEKITDTEKKAMKENITNAVKLLDDDFEII